MATLPANLPDAAKAPLPARYEAARAALAACHKLDECKDWADKMSALASYARQSEDDALLNMARKIRARAFERMGELLQEVEPSKGGRPSETRPNGGASLTRTKAAEDAGLSKRQKDTALAIAAVPKRERDAAIEAGGNVIDLARMGRKPKPKPKPPPGPPRDAEKAEALVRFVTDIRRNASGIDFDGAVRSLTAKQRATVLEAADWLQFLCRRLKEIIQ